MGDHRKFDNAQGSFMAVSVEIIDQPSLDYPEEFLVVSVAHYFEQNGDLVCDPDVTFLVSESTQIAPMTFEQGGVAYRVAMRIEKGKLLCDHRQQHDLTSFCNMWMKNIAEQQGL